jgi:hypothetical protein
VVTQEIEATGTASVRRRKLPAKRAVWLKFGMELLRDRPIQAVCDHLHLRVIASIDCIGEFERGHPAGYMGTARPREVLGPNASFRIRRHSPISFVHKT